MIFLILLGLAIAPGVGIMAYIYFQDKYDKEPMGLLVRCFFFGWLSIVVTLALSLPLQELITIDETKIFDQFVHAFIMVALIEEFSKYIFVRYYAYRKPAFDEPYDGIVYAVMVSMGFATLENLMYVAEGGLGTAILRMFTAVPAHATFGVIMGYFLGLQKFNPDKKYLGLLGLAFATIFHGAYDFFLFIHFVPGIWVGAFVSLITGIVLSRKAIKMHQKISPFRDE